MSLVHKTGKLHKEAATTRSSVIVRSLVATAIPQEFRVACFLQRRQGRSIGCVLHVGRLKISTGLNGVRRDCMHGVVDVDELNVDFV